MSNCDIKDPIEKQYELSLKNLETYFPVVGILEQFDESLIRMKQYYNWKIPYYRVLNSSKDLLYTPTQEDIDTIREYNAFEIKLYDLYKEIHLKEFHGISKKIDLVILKSVNFAYSHLKKIQDKVK